MPIGDALKSLRGNDYGKKSEEEPKDNAGARSFKLTDEEIKEISGYSEGPGAEQQCLVTGRLGPNGEFSVSSVHAPGGSEKEEMGAAMSGSQGGPPLMQMQTAPSPS